MGLFIKDFIIIKVFITAVIDFVTILFIIEVAITVMQAVILLFKLDFTIIFKDFFIFMVTFNFIIIIKIVLNFKP